VAIVLLLLPCSGCDLRERTTGLFATRDQQAQRQFDRGEYIKAAELFTDPVRQGVAWYRAGQFDKAAGAFGRSGTVEGLFNRGNALVLMGNYEGAIAGYLGVLKERPGWEPAERNIEIAGARLEKLKPPDDQPSQKGVGEDDEPDDIVFDDRAKNQESANEETVQGAGEELTDEALRALWLRRVENSPAEFLKRKFAYQHARREEGEP
jgi:Ca-activated chloride channel family protein